MTVAKKDFQRCLQYGVGAGVICKTIDFFDNRSPFGLFYFYALD